MLGFLKRSPLKALQKEHAALQQRAFEAQRNGDIRQYSLLTAEAAVLLERIEAVRAEAR